MGKYQQECDYQAIIANQVAEIDTLRMQNSPEMVDHYQALQENNAALRAELDMLNSRKPIDIVGYLDIIADKLSTDVYGRCTPEIVRQLKMYFRTIKPLYARPVPAIPEGMMMVDASMLSTAKEQSK